MNRKLQIEPITEGDTEILVFKNKSSKKGPGSKSKIPFYNPSMEFNRDISIIVNQWFLDNNEKHINILDGLAASGIRGVRLANELRGDFDVTINDWSDKSYNLIKKNLKQYKFCNVFALKKNLNSLLSEKNFHYIDIDPFGSPVYFIDSAIRSIRNNGIIACTATDTATLCGVYPKVCLRRYGIRSLHSPVMHETGLRILIGFICREAMKYNKVIEPLICYYKDYYYRVYIRVKKGIINADESAKNMKYITPKDLLSQQNNIFNIGPLWLGNIENKKVIKKLISYALKMKVNTRNKLIKLLNLLENEANTIPFYYTNEYLASLTKTSPPSLNTIFKKINEEGYDVNKTHFSSTGFKTNAPRNLVEDIFIHE